MSATAARSTESGAGGLAQAMAEVAAAVEAELDGLLSFERPDAAELVEGMRYTALGAGKRLRPFLVHAAAAVGEADPRAVRRVGAAIELIHAYSLVHDDLPAMDDAELRRGRPACHKIYGEAGGILVGDALQALAFEALARDDGPCDAATRARLVAGLARAAGVLGMCGGQALDLAAERQALDEPAIVRLQRLKTGALIAFAADAGCILGGVDAERRAAVARWAENLGLAFQIKDDLLDAQGEAAVTGKDAGRDAVLGKATFVSLLGVHGAELRLMDLRRQAFAALDLLGDGANLLRELFDFVINRRA